MNTHQNKSSLRIIFAGTPDFAAQHLESLVDSQHEVIAVYTQPDRPGKKGKKPVPGPVKQLAEKHKLTVYQPVNFKNPLEQQQLTDLKADIMVVVAYGLLLPKVVLDTPRLGCINVHASLLPRWRGAAPIERAILAGDKESGVTIMQMDEGLDTGHMLEKIHCPIIDRETGDSLAEKLIQAGRKCLVSTLAKLAQHETKGEVQNDAQSTYAGKFSKQDVQINWKLSALEIHRHIRAFHSRLVAFSIIQGLRIKIWQAQTCETNSQQLPGTIVHADKRGIQVICGKGSLLLSHIQLPGKRNMSVADVLNSSTGRALFQTGKRFEEIN